MKASICTLFEGHYHFGVGGLANSLYQNGFRGNFYAGYRGSLPVWANDAKINPSINWEGASTLNIKNEFFVHFLPLKVDIHLTNHKPSFVLDLINKVDLNAESFFYFDPDIVVKCNWNFFEKWVDFGVTLVHEIVNHDMGPTHPTRLEWKQIIHMHGHEIKREVYSYINAGFFGLKRNHTDFLIKYIEFIDSMASDPSVDLTTFSFLQDRSHPFFAKDQDALNIAAMCCDVSISEVGPDGMDFVYGGFIMAHATGLPKPWKKPYLVSALYGKPPSRAEKLFWNYVSDPFPLYSNTYYMFKKAAINVTAFIGRFYRKY